MEFLGIPLFDDDFFKLVLRFLIDFVFLFVIVRFIYFSSNKRTEYVFSYFMINILVFMICFTLKKFELELGMALGLFALFGILRYRTDAIPIREMTYLFVVIGVAVINALANKKMSYAELAFTNGAITLILFLLERGTQFGRQARKKILYEKIDLIVPEKKEELFKDLRQRTGLDIDRVEIGNVNFLRDTVVLQIFYEKTTSDNLDSDLDSNSEDSF